MDKNLISDLKKKLETEKESLIKELESFAKKDDSPKGDWETKYPNRENGTMEEEADEVQEYDNKLGVEYSLELKLRDVDIALKKIVNGNASAELSTRYGKCEKCGKEIEEDRLKAVPEARTHLKCK